MQTALCTAVVCACVCVCTHVCVCVSAPVEPCCVSYRRQLSTEHVCKGVAYLIQWEWLAWRIYQKKFSSFHMWPAEYLFIYLFFIWIPTPGVHTQSYTQHILYNKSQQNALKTSKNQTKHQTSQYVKLLSIMAIQKKKALYRSLSVISIKLFCFHLLVQDQACFGGRVTAKSIIKIIIICT